MIKCATLDMRSAVSAKGFLDDRNLERQELQAKTHLIPRSAGRFGLLTFAQLLWVNSLASQYEIVPQRIRVQDTPTIPRVTHIYLDQEVFFDDILDPLPIDLPTYDRIRMLLSAPYTPRIDFPPPFDP